jgi:hypothetical protein
MRMIFSLISLLIVVAVIGMLAKKQLSAVTEIPTTVAPIASDASTPANIAEQSKQLQTQVKDQIGAAMDAAAAARAAAEQK